MRAWAYLEIDNPMIAWLAYRGEIFSVIRNHPSAITVFMASRLRASILKLDVEMEIEKRRRVSYPHEASRLTGFFGFASREDAVTAAGLWRMPSMIPENLTEIDVHEGSTVTPRDSEWITNEMFNGPGDWIDRYLANEPRYGVPLTELTIEGSATILNTALRNKARGIVDRTWPSAHFPLELGRIAYLLGFSIGRMTAVMSRSATGIPMVDYQLDFVDAENPDFLNELKTAMNDPQFLTDRTALRPLNEKDLFVVPDMRPYSFELSSETFSKLTGTA